MNKEITVVEAQELMQAGGISLFDVRSAQEFAKGSLPGFTNLPLADISNAMPDLDGRKPALLLCSDGTQSHQAQILLEACGFNAQIIRGGLRDWALVFDAA